MKKPYEMPTEVPRTVATHLTGRRRGYSFVLNPGTSEVRTLVNGRHGVEILAWGRYTPQAINDSSEGILVGMISEYAETIKAAGKSIVFVPDRYEKQIHLIRRLLPKHIKVESYNPEI